MNNIVSDDDLRAYEMDGVVLLKNTLTSREVELLRTAVDSQFASRNLSKTAYDFQELADQFWLHGKSFSAGNATRFNLDLMSEIVREDKQAKPLYDVKDHRAGGAFFYEAAGWRNFPEIRKVALDSNLPDITASLLKSAYINFWEDTTFVKTAGASMRTPFHQDYTYFQISGSKCCIVWIPLDETTSENGALEYVIGSHKWGQEFAPSVFVSQTPLPDSPYPRLPDIEHHREDYNIRMICAEPGDIIVHDVMTIHGSAGNCSAKSARRGISFRYCGDDVKYYDKPGAMKQPWVKDQLKDGEPLYSIDYPRVWPRPFPGAELSKLYEAEPF